MCHVKAFNNAGQLTIKMGQTLVLARMWQLKN